MLEPCQQKFSEKFRGAVGVTKVEVKWCGEHADLSLAVLRSNEGLEGYVYRVPATMVIPQKKGSAEFFLFIDC